HLVGTGALTRTAFPSRRLRWGARLPEQSRLEVELRSAESTGMPPIALRRDMEGKRPGYPRSEIMTLKPVVWLGDSLAAVRGFALEARQRAGQELRRVQAGRLPVDWKPMPDIGPGVSELRVRARGAYRVIYLAKFAEAVYVLHAFEKKSRKTARLDVELAKQRCRNLVRERS